MVIFILNINMHFVLIVIPQMLLKLVIMFVNCIFLNVGEQKCIIQKYKCKKCGKIFYTDIKSIVDENCNITKPVIEYINEIYSVSGNSIYKIQYMLKRFFNVDISHQSIESCIIIWMKMMI